MSTSPLKVVTVPIASLLPDPTNVRTHDQKNLDAIRRSLVAFGQRKPVVCARANDGSRVVIAGNGTMEAAKNLGWKEIAIVDVPDDWDAERARAYAIADNRTAELADWNKVELANALLELDAVGWNVSDLGFAPTVPDGEPDFSPVEEEQPRLDQRNPICCPNCKFEWRVGARGEVEPV